jgi:hypothetical protein
VEKNAPVDTAGNVGGERPPTAETSRVAVAAQIYLKPKYFSSSLISKASLISLLHIQKVCERHRGNNLGRLRQSLIDQRGDAA